LKPVLLGCESHARYLQTGPPQAPMLLVILDVALGRSHDQIQITFPFAAVESLIGQLAKSSELESEPAPAPAAPAPAKWNPCFDNVCIPVAVQWPALEVAAREVLNLKVGDVLRIDGPSAQQVKVCLAGNEEFHGRLGAVAGKWAVELMAAIKH